MSRIFVAALTNEVSKYTDRPLIAFGDEKQITEWAVDYARAYHQIEKVEWAYGYSPVSYPKQSMWILRFNYPLAIVIYRVYMMGLPK